MVFANLSGKAVSSMLLQPLPLASSLALKSPEKVLDEQSNLFKPSNLQTRFFNFGKQKIPISDQVMDWFPPPHPINPCLHQAIGHFRIFLPLNNICGCKILNQFTLVAYSALHWTAYSAKDSSHSEHCAHFIHNAMFSKYLQYAAEILHWLRIAMIALECCKIQWLHTKQWLHNAIVTFRWMHCGETVWSLDFSLPTFA